MGQPVAAAEHVADPLDGPLAAGPPADGQADDLLSQLAGAEIDRMLAEADVEPAALPPAAPPPPPVVVMPAPVADPPPAVVPPPEPVAAVPPPPEPTAADLDAVLAHAAAAPAAAGPIDLGERSFRLPLFLRPLVLLNAPLDPYPDRVRDAVGKVAVVTLVNAVAVLAYVLIFRRHA